MIVSLLKFVSDFTAFFLKEKEFFNWRYLLKKAPGKTKIVPPVWNKISKIWDTLFELIQTSTMQQKKFKALVPQEAGAFENKIEKDL